MHNSYKSFLPFLIALLFLVVSCSPEYGAHFAPSKTDKLAKASKELKQAPLQVQETTASQMAIEQRGSETGATDIIVAPSTPRVSTEKVISVKRQQRAALRQLRTKLKGMSKEERAVFQEQVLNQLKEQQLAMRIAQGDDAAFTPPPPADTNMILLAVVTFFIPPLGVFLHQGEINSKFWISLVLTLLLWLPGMIYSMLVVFDQI